jgi:surfeit locus 1 family protein
VLTDLKNRQFRPSLFGCVLTIAGALCAVRLGVWQLHRADEKQALIDQFTQGQLRTLTLTPDTAAAVARYQHVRVAGRYDSDHQVLLDNMPAADGRAGFRVLTPLQLPDGQWLLVDRGWVPLGVTRSDLPDVHVAAQPGEVVGRIDELPEPGLRLGENPEPSATASWPRVLTYPRLAELEKVMNRPLLPRVLLLDATQPQGYERKWGANFGIGPTRHLAYAVQWFAMGIAMVCVFLIVSFRKRTGPNDKQ